MLSAMEGEIIREFYKELMGSGDISAVMETTLANRIACEMALFFEGLEKSSVAEEVIKKAKELTYD